MICGSAIFSDCGRYRYRLERIWDPQKPIVPWVLLNASTADANRNDPTVTRLIGFTRRWNFGGFVLVNAYAAVATRPRDLFAMVDNVGKENQYHVQTAIRDSQAKLHLFARARRLAVIVAWGNHGRRYGHDRTVMNWIRSVDPPVGIQCLGVTKPGCPVHPLYRRADAKRLAYEDGKHSRPS